MNFEGDGSTARGSAPLSPGLFDICDYRESMKREVVPEFLEQYLERVADSCPGTAPGEIETLKKVVQTLCCFYTRCKQEYGRAARRYWSVAVNQSVPWPIKRRVQYMNLATDTMRTMEQKKARESPRRGHGDELSEVSSKNWANFKTVAKIQLELHEMVKAKVQAQMPSTPDEEETDRQVKLKLLNLTDIIQVLEKKQKEADRNSMDRSDCAMLLIRSFNVAVLPAGDWKQKFEGLWEDFLDDGDLVCPVMLGMQTFLTANMLP